MRWARLALVTFVAGCGAVGAEPETRPDAADVPARTVASAAARPRVGRRRATVDAAPQIESAPDASAGAGDAPEETGTWVRGCVVDADGAPLADATVMAFLGADRPDAKTDGAGRFAVSVSEPTGAVRCFAWKVDHAIVVGPWFALREGGSTDVGTLRCGRAAPIEGRILGKDGSPVYGHVSFESATAYDDETWALLRRCTDLDGEETTRGRECGFSERSLPPGRYVLRASGSDETVTVDAPAADVRVPAPPSGPWTFDVEVRVLEWDGAPAAGLVPHAVPHYSWQHLTETWRVDRTSMTVHVVSDETQLVSIEATTPDGRTASREVSAANTELVELKLPRYAPSEQRSIRGVVTFGGRPVTYVTDECCESRGTRMYVSASATGEGYGPGFDKSAVTNPDGTFEFDGLDPGEYALCARIRDAWDAATNFAGMRVVAVSGRTDVTIEMLPSRTRPFRIVLPSGFGAIDDYDLCVEGPDGEGDDPDDDRTDDALIVSRLRAGVAYTMTLRVRCGAVWTLPARVAFTAGDDAIQVRLDAGLRVTGRVVRADGTPVVAANVWVERDGDDFSHETYADLDGRFTIGSLAPGAWTLKASAPGLCCGDDGVPVDAGAENLRVRLDAER